MPKNMEELALAAMNLWENISLYRCPTLIAHMRPRSVEVIINGGGSTSYLQTNNIESAI